MAFHSRRGNYATVTAVSLTALLGFGALAIDVSHVNLVEQQLQNGADAIAHGAVMFLDGTDDGLETAKTVATELAAVNHAGGKTFSIDGTEGATGTIEFGTWDTDLRTFTVSSDAEVINAVRVNTGHDDTATAMVDLVSDAKLEPVAQSVAVRNTPGAGAADCFLPFAVASCLIEDQYGVDGVQDVELKFASSTIDNVGWARPQDNPNTSWLRAQIGDCTQDGEVAIGDTVELSNGQNASAQQDMASEIESSDTSWDSEVWGTMPDQLDDSSIASESFGNTLEGVFITFDDDTFCEDSGKNFNGTVTVDGLVWGAVYEVVATGGDKHFRVRLDTSRQHEIGSDDGGNDWGVQVVQVALAQ